MVVVKGEYIISFFPSILNGHYFFFGSPALRLARIIWGTYVPLKRKWHKVRVWARGSNCHLGNVHLILDFFLPGGLILLICCHPIFHYFNVIDDSISDGWWPVWCRSVSQLKLQLRWKPITFSQIEVLHACVRIRHSVGFFLSKISGYFSKKHYSKFRNLNFYQFSPLTFLVRKWKYQMISLGWISSSSYKWLWTSENSENAFIMAGLSFEMTIWRLFCCQPQVEKLHYSLVDGIILIGAS